MSDQPNDILQIAKDAVKKHGITINPHDASIHALIRYALCIGQSQGWRDAVKYMEEYIESKKGKGE